MLGGLGKMGRLDWRSVHVGSPSTVWLQ